jgi:hypothetical protein
MSRLADRLDAWINPVVLKDLSQGARSHGFVLGTLVALALGLVSYLIAVVGDEAEAGRTMAAMVGFGMSLTTLIVVPWGVRAQLEEELSSRTFELMAISGLTPGRVAFGLLLSGVLRVTLSFALMAPFVVATVMLGGVSTEGVLLGLTGLFCAALLGICAMAALVVIAHATGMPPMVLRMTIIAPPMWFLFVGVLLVSLMFDPPPDALLAGVQGAAVTLGTSMWLTVLTADALVPERTRAWVGSKLVLPPLLAGALAMGAWAGAFDGSEFSVRNSVRATWAMLVMTLGPIAVGWTASHRVDGPWWFAGGLAPSLLYVLAVWTGLAVVLTGLSPTSVGVAWTGPADLLLILGGASLARALTGRHASTFAWWLGAIGTLTAMLLWEMLLRAFDEPEAISDLLEAFGPLFLAPPTTYVADQGAVPFVVPSAVRDPSYLLAPATVGAAALALGEWVQGRARVR